jgi:hypothetical protein
LEDVLYETPALRRFVGVDLGMAMLAGLFAGLLFGSLTPGGFAEWRAVPFKFERDSRGLFKTFQADTGVRGGKIRKVGEVWAIFPTTPMCSR